MGLRGPVLVATDLSEAADDAIRQAAALAAGLGVPCVACHVMPEAFRTRVLFPQEAGVDATTQAQLDARARHVLQERLKQVLGPVASGVEIEIESGSAPAGILAVAERRDAGVLVIGHGRTALRVARSGGLPVLITRPSPEHGPVIGATDFSDPSLPAVRLAADEARRRQAPLRIIHCLDVDPTAYLAPAGTPGMMPMSPVPQGVFDQLEAEARERLAAAREAAGGEGEMVVLSRPPALGIVDDAREVAASLIVVGTRGRSGLARFALGSVAEDVASDASCSVLVVPLQPA